MRTSSSSFMPLRLQAFFDPADPIFQDHFPGCPVVPGSLTLACFQKTIESSASADVLPGSSGGRLKAVRNARFLRFGRPGRLEVEVRCEESLPEETVYACTAAQNGETIATALLVYEAYAKKGEGEASSREHKDPEP